MDHEMIPMLDSPVSLLLRFGKLFDSDDFRNTSVDDQLSVFGFILESTTKNLVVSGFSR